MSTERRSWIATAVAVAAVCALALVLRTRGLEHSLPHSTFRDGYYVFSQVESLRTDDPHPESNPFWVMYPHFVARAVAALPDPEREPLEDGATLDVALERAAEPWMQIRRVSAWLSVLAVLATFGIARAFLSRGWSLFAALLVAASLLEIFFAQQEKCHGPAAGTATLAVLAAMLVRRRPTLVSFALGGAAAGAAIGTLQSGAAVLCASMCAVVLAWREGKATRARVVAGTVLALGIVAACLYVFYPFWFSGVEVAREPGLAVEPDSSIGFSGHHIEIDSLDGGGFLVVLDTLLSFEPVALALALVASVVLLARFRSRTKSAHVERGDLWVVLAYVVPYTLAVGIYSLSYERFVMPLVPYVAITAAFGAREIAALLARRFSASHTTAIHGAVALVALTPAVTLAWKLGSVRAANDTTQRAAAWIAEHAKPESDRVQVLPYIDLPLYYTAEATRENAAARGDVYWTGWQAAHADVALAGPRFDVRLPLNSPEEREALNTDAVAYYRELGADFVVVQDVGENFRNKALVRAGESLRALGEPIARFSPLRDDTGESAKLAIRYTKSAFVQPFFVHLWALESEGATLEIYALGETREPALTAEQRAQIEALEAIGYAGGTLPADELSGVTVFDEARAEAGLNVLVSGHAPRAELVDMRATPVHAWQRSFEEIWPGRALPVTRNDSRTWRRVRVLANGELLAIFEGLGLVKLDKRSNVLWSFDGLAHHALDVAADGRVFVLTRKAHVNPRFHADKAILEDFVTILDAEGRELESISVLECFERSNAVSERALHAGDIFHTNSLSLLDGRHSAKMPAFAAGNVLVSLRHTNQLAVLDLRERTAPWVLEGSWKQQHEPVLLEDGHVLLFDNKGRRERSSALEIDPTSGAELWSYSPAARGEFYSASCGSVQRLANGNTLIVSTEQARAFEVTRAGEIVWEYRSPHRLPEDRTIAAMLFDCVRMPRDFDTSWIQ